MSHFLRTPTGTDFLVGVLSMRFSINPWHKASGATQHLFRQAISRNSTAGNPDCVVSMGYVHHGAPKVEVKFENGPTMTFDMTGFAPRLKTFYAELNAIKQSCQYRRMLQDDEFDDPSLEDSTHANIDAFIKELAERRRADFGDYDDAFDAAWESNDPLKIEEFRAKWMPQQPSLLNRKYY